MIPSTSSSAAGPSAGSSPPLADVVEAIADHPSLSLLADRIEGGGDLTVRGAVGSSPTLATAALAARLGRPILLVFAHLDDADVAADELLELGIEALRLPAVEIAPGESGLNLDLVAERLRVAARVAGDDPPAVVTCSIHALMQTLPAPDRMAAAVRRISIGDRVDQTGLVRWLTEAGYTRVETIEAVGELAVRGGIVDVFSPGGEPVRIDLFGDEVDDLRAIDLDSMGSDRRLEHADLVATKREALLGESGGPTIARALSDAAVGILVETLEITEQGRSYWERVQDAGGLTRLDVALAGLRERCWSTVELGQLLGRGGAGDDGLDLPVSGLPVFEAAVSKAIGEVAELAGDGPVAIACPSDGDRDRLAELVDQFVPDAVRPAVRVVRQLVGQGFRWGRGGDGSPVLSVIAAGDLLHRPGLRRRAATAATGRGREAFIDLRIGDHVVHRDHGIARFRDLRTMRDESAGSDGREEEYLTLEFARGALLHVPASKIGLVQKYVGASAAPPQLSTLGGRRWKAQKERVGEAVRDLASEMLRIQAARESLEGTRYPDDTAWLREFEASFPHEETDDQLAAIAAVKRDLQRSRPMDRLVCGDVGFGKTEVAIRAAFKVAEFGRQVAVLVPTTVLAEQHERTFRERFDAYPFRLESLSRFKTKGEQTAIIRDVAAGKVDVLIGTHRIVSRDVRFADLGLVIIDEEQRFGVEHKHRLLELRATVDVLTMSATPIPRTLHMAMLGLRDISSLTMAPVDRRSIVTEVIAWNEERLKQAIERELSREGQVFYVHNRVHDIHEVADDVRRLAPGARVIVGHGQMPAGELERVMLAFIRREADVLVSTTIIESGIDIPTANTMVIDEASRFGLAELHQLRGRVGRSSRRAYCYLLLPRDGVLSDIASKRLRAIEGFSMLGSGFRIAMRDLELRGAGNLLGAEQSGHISAVGYELYCHLLARAVDALKNQRAVEPLETVVDLGIAGSIPPGYIPSVPRRLDAYRRIATARDQSGLEAVESDLVSAYGEVPRATRRLLDLAHVRAAAAGLGIRTVTRREQDVVFRTAEPARLEAAMQGVKGTVRVVGQPSREGLTEIYHRPPKRHLEERSLLTTLRHRLGRAASGG